MVPLGNLAFALPFVPGATPLRDSDVAGLCVILLGLVTYRFGNVFPCGLGCCRGLRWTVPPLSWRREVDEFIDSGNSRPDLVGLRVHSDLSEEPLLPPVQ